jgi:tripartite ATP-independent transporter DctM subunit
VSWLLLGSSLLITISSGVVIGAALGLTGMVLLHFMAGGSTGLMITATWNTLTDFTLSAVPVFIILGEILLASGLSNRMYGSLSPLFHRVPGRLLHSNVAVCTLFGAVSGSSMATAAAVGSVAYPELVRRGYHQPTVIASLAGAGTLGILIPPSLPLILYGATQDVSIGRLFLAGILPGLMMAAMFMAYLLVLGLKRPDLAPGDDRRPTVREILLGLLDLWPLAFVIFAVLGTIYLGLATPTESAGLGVATTILLGFAFGDLTWKSLWRAFVSSTVTFGTIALILIGAVILAQAISILGLPRHLVEAVTSGNLSKYEVLSAIVVVYLILGCFFDGVSLLLMTIPFTFPLMTGVGFDKIWFGVIVTMLIEIGMITPPVGLNLYVLIALTNKRVSLAEASIHAIPYWLLLLVGIAILTWFPEIALILPRQMD